MIILLDTHVWLWAVSSPARLGSQAKRLLEDGDNSLLLSAASSWEMSIKYRLGKLKLPSRPTSFVLSRMARDGVKPLPVEHSHALVVADLEDHHRDPFDRLLAAQCVVEKIPLMTVDRQFARYPIQLIYADE